MEDNNDSNGRVKRLSVNLRPECAEKLLKLRDELETHYGMKLSVSGTVEYLIRNHKFKQPMES